MDSRIKLSTDKKEEMITMIKNYFLKERDEEIGDLAAKLILDFFLEKLGPDIYNQGIYDSYNYMNDRLIDILGIQL
jgi:uncharacterized protein (DUF2164 family)